MKAAFEKTWEQIELRVTTVDTCNHFFTPTKSIPLIKEAAPVAAHCASIFSFESIRGQLSPSLLNESLKVSIDQRDDELVNKNGYHNDADRNGYHGFR